MKNLSMCLFLVAIASLLCLFASGDRNHITTDYAIAGLPEPVPCCYNSPLGHNPLTNTMAANPSLYLDDQLTSSLTKELELQTSIQFGAEFQISFAEAGIPTAFGMKNREIYYGELM
jgi:hypothetical protein